MRFTGKPCSFPKLSDLLKRVKTGTGGSSQSPVSPGTVRQSFDWVAVKDLNLSYYVEEALLFTIYTHYGNLIQVPEQQPN